MRLQLIFVTLLSGIVYIVHGCSPSIEVVGMRVKFKDICTTPIQNDGIDIKFNLTSNELDLSCVQFNLTKIIWTLYKYSENKTSETVVVEKKEEGTSETGDVSFKKNALSYGVYALSSQLEIFGGSTVQEIVVIGYFVHGSCETTYQQFEQQTGDRKNAKCYAIYDVTNIAFNDTFVIQGCGEEVQYYGVKFCTNHETVKCESGAQELHHCHEAAIMYGKKTESFNGNCQYKDGYTIKHDGIWTENGCKAEFEICTQMNSPSDPMPSIDIPQNTYSSCADVYTKNPLALNRSYSLQIAPGESQTVHCEFYHTHTYTYLSPIKLNSINIRNLYNDKTMVIIRHLFDNGTQGEAYVGQIKKYKAQDISVFYNSHDGYEAIASEGMGPYIYVGFLPIDGINHKKDVQGYSVNGHDYTFTNCDGNANSYFVLLFNENGTQFSRSGAVSKFMTHWIDKASPVPAERKLPVEFFSQFEMHMGGCGGLMTSNQIPGMTGAAIGLKYGTQIPGIDADVTPGACLVFPPTGYALLTNFSIKCDGFSASDGSELTYKMYANTHNQLKHAVKIYDGKKAEVTGIKLQGSESADNFLYIFVIASAEAGGSANISTEAEVLAQSQTETIDLMYDVVIGNKSGEPSQIDQLLNAGDSEAAVQLISIISSTINSLNSSSDDNQIKEKKSLMRSALVSNLEKVPISDFESLITITDVLNDVTDDKTELSEKTQDDASNLYDNLADSFDGFLSGASSDIEVKETAESILKGVTGILDVVTVKGREKLNNNTGSKGQVNTTSDTIVKEQQSIEKIKNSTDKLLNTLNKVSGSMLSQQMVGQPPTVIQTDTVTVSVQKRQPSTLANSSINPSNEVGGSNMKFDESFPTLSGDVGIKVAVMKNNPFIWDETASDVTSEVLTVDLANVADNSKITVANLSSPVLISLKTPDTPNNTETKFHLNLIKTNNIIKYNTTKYNVMSVNFTLSPNKTAVLKINPTSGITKLKILLSDDHQPSLEEILNYGFFYPYETHLQLNYTNFMFADQNVSAIIEEVDSGLMFFHHNTSGDTGEIQTIFVGMTVDINDTETLVQVKDAYPKCLRDLVTCSSVVKVPVHVETKVLSCTYWDVEGQTWSSEGCEVSPYSTIDTLKCACSHLTSFAGGVFVLPNFVDPIGDAELFLTFFDNPLVVTVVIIVWIVYFFLVHWARQADKNDTEKVGVIYCNDNDVTHKYSYLVCVVTGWWKDAGTTANVFIYIQGKKGASPRRKLSTGARLCFQTGYEDWFLVTTETSLGTITQVTFWHDNSGTSPHWYLNQAYIQDTQTGQGWTFIYNDWLAVDRGALLQTTGTVASVTQEQLKTKQKHNFMMKTVQGFRDGHIWISVFSKPPRSSFTRVQRLTCALSLLLTTMLTNIMFYGIPTDEPGDQVGSAGGINISLSAIVIGIQSSLIMFPVNILILQLFIRVKSKLMHKVEKKKNAMRKEHELKSRLASAESIKEKVMNKFPEAVSSKKSIDGFERSEKTNQVENKSLYLPTGKSVPTEMDAAKVQTKTSGFLPWWFLYISWFLVVSICLTCSYFVMLYGLKYGYDKSVAWIVSFLTGFTQSAFIVQPMKVICIAVLMSLILKKTVEFEDIGANIDLDKDEEYLCLTKDHKESHIPYSEPLSSRLLRQIRHRLKLEWLMNAAIRDIILYVMYLAVVMFVVHGHRDIKQAYRNTLAIEDVLVNPGCIKLWKCFYLEKADKVEMFYQYMEDVAVPSLADMSIADHDYATPGSSHFLVGPYRLRQLRVAKGACSNQNWLLEKFDMRLPDCTGAYWMGDEDNQHYHLNWTTKLSEAPSEHTLWTYQSAWSLKTIPFAGKLATYSGGGYVLTMPNDTTLHAGIIKDLWNTEWIDERTSAIFLEFTLYNPNADLFSVVMIIFEFSNSGGVLPHHQIFSTQLFHYSTDFGIFILVCEVSFLLFNIGFTYIEYKRLKKIGKKAYFSDKWSYVELLQIALAFSVIGLFFHRLVSVNSIMNDFRASKGDKFVSFYTAVTWDYILGYVMGFLVCLVTLKFIKLLEFNRKMFMLSDVLSRSKGALISFIVLAIVVTVGFAHFTYMAFGRDLHGYRSMPSSIMTVFNFALGVSDLPGLQGVNRVLGPAFFFIFVFVVNICFLTIFMAILNFGINESKTLFKQKKNKFELLDYISSKLKLVLAIK